MYKETEAEAEEGERTGKYACLEVGYSSTLL